MLEDSKCELGLPGHHEVIKNSAYFIGHCNVLCLVTQLCPTLCDPLDCSPPGSLFMGILQAEMLEWVAMRLL